VLATNPFELRSGFRLARSKVLVVAFAKEVLRADLRPRLKTSNVLQEPGWRQKTTFRNFFLAGENSLVLHVEDMDDTHVGFADIG
jgi:hypothetical protein